MTANVRANRVSIAEASSLLEILNNLLDDTEYLFRFRTRNRKSLCLVDISENEFHFCPVEITENEFYFCLVDSQQNF